MLLAEIEIRHSRAIAPTRRLALGEIFLPTGDGPGDGGLLLAGIVAAFVGGLDEELATDLDTLLDDLERGRRVVQPRMRYRFQADTHGLDRSRHRLRQVADAFHLEIDDHGAALPQVLGAVYAAAMLSFTARGQVFRLIRRATRWEGGVDASLVAYLTGDEAARFRRRWTSRDARWALQVLRFAGDASPDRDDVQKRFRELVRKVHPDHGARGDGAGARIDELSEAKRILLGR